mmetsp:Transcript_89875/g.155669  ORF Transcript_89875/g.155669 Transcript_89875/m.155669 type:complete len:94 (-) Transcript_89875:210-491(-)
MANPVELRMRAISTKVNPKPVLDDLAAGHRLVLLHIAFLVDKYKIPKGLVVSRPLWSQLTTKVVCLCSTVRTVAVLKKGPRTLLAMVLMTSGR